MRLINVTSFILEEFFGDKVPEYEYAILSHTWDDEEVTFQDIIGSREAARNKKGFAKIQYLIDQARKDNIKWAWIDTCCIDKKSSAELSEAINSMWLWYSRSAVCYAYCADVPGGEDSAAMGSAFRKSRWFTRGWTLQELIAPYQVCFYSKDWTKIGMKMNSKYWSAEASLWRDGSTKTLPLLSEITGIPQEMLSGKKDKNEYSVAQRMSWASRRECTRQEDTAYCLLGIFDVNMPLLYGEEGGAFIRLQKEIMQNTDDHSIYAWTVPRWNPTIWAADSVLARSPAYFAKSGDVVPTKEEVDDLSIITKQGLRISLPLLKYEYPINHTLFARDKYCETFRATLNCRIGDKELQILLVKDSSTRSRWLRDHWYFRLGTLDHLFPEGDTTIPQNFFVRLEIPIKIWSAFRFPQSLRIHGLPVLLLPARASQDGGGPTDLMRMADNIGNYGLVDADLQARNCGRNYDSIILVCGIDSLGRVLCKLHLKTSLPEDISMKEHQDTYAKKYFTEEWKNGAKMANVADWVYIGSNYGNVASSALEIKDLTIRATLGRSVGEYEALGPTRKSFIVAVDISKTE